MTKVHSVLVSNGGVPKKQRFLAYAFDCLLMLLLMCLCVCIYRYVYGFA